MVQCGLSRANVIIILTGSLLRSWANFETNITAGSSAPTLKGLNLSKKRVRLALTLMF